MTERLFQHDAYLQRCTARVVEATPEGIVLDRTVFYARGGGQRSHRVAPAASGCSTSRASTCNPAAAPTCARQAKSGRSS